MLHIPALRWGEPYKSLDTETIVRFDTGEPMGAMSKIVGGLVERDMRFAQRARSVLCDIAPADLLEMCKKAGELYLQGTLEVGGEAQTPEDFVRQQSATTGLPYTLCRNNMKKNHFVLQNMPLMLDALTRGLDSNILRKGYGMEARGVPLSYQAHAPVLGMVLPNNSPGVHALWLPVIPFQIGLVIKPGPAEPWTPYRMAAAFFQAGIPRQAMSLYPGGIDIGAAVLSACQRSLIFGGQAVVDTYKGNPKVQVHGPGWSKVILGDDHADNWEKYLPLMAESIAINSGRGCINASAIFTPRHGKKIAEALAEKLGPLKPLPPDDPNSALAAFTTPALAIAINNEIDTDLKTAGAIDYTAKFGQRLEAHERHAYLRPTIIYCESPDHPSTKREYLFPYAAVVECPQEKMIEKIGSTLVCSALTSDPKFQRQLLDAVNIDRLNIGAIPTTQLNWLQPHEGNIVEFLFRNRAFQYADKALAI
ncbi:MAG TPA: aldehyde dehydrogenase family protein [Gemmatales bacterium]|nr:aldehyde dehydrogenase family protein [Gemmatales bacterium]